MRTCGGRGTLVSWPHASLPEDQETHAGRVAASEGPPHTGRRRCRRAWRSVEAVLLGTLAGVSPQLTEGRVLKALGTHARILVGSVSVVGWPLSPSPGSRRKGPICRLGHCSRTSEADVGPGASKTGAAAERPAPVLRSPRWFQSHAGMRTEGCTRSWDATTSARGRKRQESEEVPSRAMRVMLGGA
jgi:hypothetical protein